MMLCCAGAGMRLHAQPLNKGRIAILGDSIAYAGHWANEVENTLRDDKKFAAREIVNFAVPSETVAGLSEYTMRAADSPVHARMSASAGFSRCTSLN